MIAFLAAAAALMVCVTVSADNVYAKPRSQATPMAMYDSIAACEEVRYSGESPVNCVVTNIQGHPTLAVEFANEPSMNAYLGEFSERIATPFCEAANKDNQSAFFVVALKNPRVGSVSSCETGESSEWVTLDSLGQSN
ncbi:MAG: hypothetical protein JSU95_05085 [Betaproteobacteria bacterium]|nr:MAG: hypothetical protein JSU95_05085 [Betaproteobacteria bacterium]